MNLTLWSEEIFVVFIFVEREPFKPQPYQMIASLLTRANLALPKLVTVKIDVNDEKAKSQVVTTGDGEGNPQGDKEPSNFIHTLINMTCTNTYEHTSQWRHQNLQPGSLFHGEYFRGCRINPWNQGNLYPVEISHHMVCCEYFTSQTDREVMVHELNIC